MNTIIDVMADELFVESQEHDVGGRFMRKLQISDAYDVPDNGWRQLHHLVKDICNKSKPDEFIHFRDLYFRVRLIPEKYILKGADDEFFARPIQDSTSPDSWHGFTLVIQYHFFKLDKTAQMYILISTLGLIYAPGNFEGWFAGIRAQDSRFWTEGEIQPQYVIADRWTQKEMNVSDQFMLTIFKSIDTYYGKTPCPMKITRGGRYLNYLRSLTFNKTGLMK